MENMLHRVMLTEREQFAASGVTEVLGFDENEVVMKTGQGILHIHGQNLRLTKLTPEGGDISLSGKVDAIVYQQPRKPSPLRRLLP